MNMLKAKFNVEKIANGDAIYPKSFIDLVTKYENKIIEVDEEVFGCYELELEGETFALDKDELIFDNEV